MKPLIKFSGLSLRDKSLLAQSVVLLAGIRLGLWVFSFAKMRQLLNEKGEKAQQLERANPDPGKVIWAIQITARYVPAATCLTQALATRLLLGWYGHPAYLRIGVCSQKEGHFQAHAWVESGEIIANCGAPDLSRYTPLPNWETPWCGKGI